MPVKLHLDNPQPTRSGVRLNLDAESAPTPDNAGSGLSDLVGPAGLVGGAGLILAGVAAKNPGMIGSLARGVGNLRQQAMLSGLAVPKAIVSNIGGAAIASAERRSMDPLKKLLSLKTIQDIVSSYKTGAQSHVQAAGGKAMHGPGRVLGAIDEASQAAFGRAGISPEDADRITFQTPLNEWAGELGHTLDSPAMRYLLPFRRTPFNALREGALTMKPENLRTGTQKALLGGAVAAGATHGAATSDEQYPVSLGLGAATANKFALPYLLAASGGRALAGGSDPEAVAGEALPISEYGIASGITNPTHPFTNPAALRVLRRLLGE